MPGRVLVTFDALDPVAERAALSRDRHTIGGVCIFEGLVREFSGSDHVSLTLEHYPGMTEKALEAIRVDAGARWPLQALSILHRVGRMLPGECIVAVIACSAHRQAAFEACAFTMDYLKTQAPFWKLEDDGQGQADWVDARESDRHARERWQGGD